MDKENTLRWWDLPAAIILIVALLTAATRLVVTDWTDYLYLAQNLALLGVVSGLAIGQSRFSPRIAAFFAISYGAFAVPWQLGSTLGTGIPWTERLFILSSRLNIVIDQLIKHEVVQDSLLFIVLMSVLFWVLGVHAGYTLTRYGVAWQAVLPTGLALFVIHSFDAIITRRAWYLAIYLFFSLVLVARSAYLQHHKRWQDSRTALPPHLGLDFIRFTLLAAAVLVIFAWTVPALAESLSVAERAWQPVRHAWNITRDRFDEAFASLRSTVGVVSDYYGSSLMLGRGNLLTDAEVFRVKPPDDAPPGQRYYWRARVVDYYFNSGWDTTSEVLTPFDPEGGTLVLPETTSRFRGLFDFVPANHVSTVFVPGQPEWMNKPATVEHYRNPDGTMDVAMFRASPVIRAGNPYQVQASVGNFTVKQLRDAANEEYPDWILQRYLQLPDNITPRTRELAMAITEGIDNPYDKVVAITNFLRTNIVYTRTVPEQPNNQEAIDWFLFDLKQGFCNYYASAEVILLRAIGIPARYAVGFAQGERLDNGWYVVRQRDAHAWPEVYFPTLGWVEFEPTAAQPAISRRLGEDPNAVAERNPSLDRARNERLAELLQQEQGEGAGNVSLDQFAPQPDPWWQAVMRLGAYLVGTVILVALAWGTVRYRFNLPSVPDLISSGLVKMGLQPPQQLRDWSDRGLGKFTNLRLPPLPVLIERVMVRLGLRPPSFLAAWAYQASLPPLSRSYMEINRALARLGDQPYHSATPTERVTALSTLLPPADPPARRLLQEYERETFSRERADLPEANRAAGEIRSLSYRASLRKMLTELLNKVQRKEQTSRSRSLLRW